MGRNCYTCEVLKELYWLKMNQFLMAMRSAPGRPRSGDAYPEDELNALKDEALAALKTLMRHAKACYGLVRDEAA